MRVYLIAAPEDESEAEKLAEYLKRFGVFIRTEYGRMAYPPAHHGEYTLALWSRNAMMSSRQMMLTNRAIDAWEDGQLVMARLEHGLSPRGLADLDMVDLTFAAAREHRYHDVLNAIRKLDDAQKGRIQAPSSPPSASTPSSSAPPLADVSAPSKTQKKGWLSGLFGGGGAARKKSQASEAKGVAPESENEASPAEEVAAVPAPDQARSGHAVFVSYSHANAETVLPLVETVEAGGLSIWIDRDELRAGQNWAGQIVRAIKSSDRFCLMCSEQAFASDHVRREVYLADKYGKDMVPIRLDGAEMPEDIEYFLIGRQWVDLNAIDESERLAAIEAALSGIKN